jgi:CBS-domain-containing membrane protein
MTPQVGRQAPANVLGGSGIGKVAGVLSGLLASTLLLSSVLVYLTATMITAYRFLHPDRTC